MLQIVTKSLVFIIFISVYNKLHNSKKNKKKKKKNVHTKYIMMNFQFQHQK
jgi:hypothetical protein